MTKNNISSLYYQHEQEHAHSVYVMLFGDKTFCDNNYFLNVNYLLVLTNYQIRSNIFQVSVHLLYYY